jgi:hypothetical protein
MQKVEAAPVKEVAALPVKEVAAAPVVAAAPTVVRKSSFLERLSAFAAGVITASGGAAYYIYNDLRDSNTSVSSSLSKLNVEIHSCNEDLRKRIEKLEAKLLK